MNDTKWLDEHWNDLRENTDAALKVVGSMPVAIHAIEHDPDHIQQLMLKLSDCLTALSVHIGERRPEGGDSK